MYVFYLNINAYAKTRTHTCIIYIYTCIHMQPDVYVYISIYNIRSIPTDSWNPPLQLIKENIIGKLRSYGQLSWPAFTPSCQPHQNANHIIIIIIIVIIVIK